MFRDLWGLNDLRVLLPEPPERIRRVPEQRVVPGTDATETETGV